MAYKIIETEQAQQDLCDIVAYIVSALENRSAAAALLDEVEACYDHLERHPLMFEACHDPHLKALGYRKAGIKNYIMIYKVDGDDKNSCCDALFPRQAGLRKASLIIISSKDRRNVRSVGLFG